MTIKFSAEDKLTIAKALRTVGLEATDKNIKAITSSIEMGLDDDLEKLALNRAQELEPDPSAV